LVDSPKDLASLSLSLSLPNDFREMILLIFFSISFNLIIKLTSSEVFSEYGLYAPVTALTLFVYSAISCLALSYAWKLDDNVLYVEPASFKLLKNIVLSDEYSKSFLEALGKDKDKESEAKSLGESTKALKKEIQNTIDTLISKKKKRKTKQTNTKTKIAKNLSTINTASADTKKYESFVELIKDLDIELTDELEAIFYLIDEQFIQAYSENSKQYQEILHELKSKINDLNI